MSALTDRLTREILEGIEAKYVADSEDTAMWLELIQQEGDCNE